MGFAQASAARIILVGRRLEVLEKVKGDLCSAYAKCHVLAESCDVSEEKDVEGLFAKLKSLNTEVDVLVNNAGVNLSRNPVKESEAEDWLKTFVGDMWLLVCRAVLISFFDQEINLKGPYIVARAFLHQHTPGKPAAIVMTSSLGSYALVPSASAYGASKAALNRITEYIAAENKDDGVQAIAFHPGGVGGTDLTSKSPAFMRRFYTETPELAAGTVVYLTTHRAAYLNGRYVDARWDLEELERLKEKIEKEDLLRLSLLGDERVRF